MNLRILGASVIAGASTLLASGHARADGPAQAFGRQGHLAISGDANVGVTNASVSGENGSTTTIVVRPAADYFVVRGLSIGAFVPFEYSSTSNTGSSTTTIGVGARVGYDVPIGDSFSFWPRAGLSYTSISESFSEVSLGTTGITSVTGSNSAFSVSLFAPFLVHPAEHFFLGLGPELGVDLTGQDKVTTYGLSFLIGGYFLGD